MMMLQRTLLLILAAAGARAAEPTVGGIGATVTF